MSKKVIAILVAASIISTLIIGCSKKPVEEQPATAVDTTQTEQSVAPAGELIGDNVKFDTGKDLEGELNVWFYEDGKRFIQPLFDDY